jgi:hypothetical protein
MKPSLPLLSISFWDRNLLIYRGITHGTRKAHSLYYGTLFAAVIHWYDWAKLPKSKSPSRTSAVKVVRREHIIRFIVANDWWRIIRNPIGIAEVLKRVVKADSDECLP